VRWQSRQSPPSAQGERSLSDRDGSTDMTSDPTPNAYRSDKPCAQPICRHRRSEHLDGGAVGDDHHCRMCKCSAYVSGPRMVGRRLLRSFLRIDVSGAAGSTPPPGM
jgi:hypothetical protein